MKGFFLMDVCPMRRPVRKSAEFFSGYDESEEKPGAVFRDRHERAPQASIEIPESSVEGILFVY